MGSSMKMIAGLEMTVHAMVSRRFSPPAAFDTLSKVSWYVTLINNKQQLISHDRCQLQDARKSAGAVSAAVVHYRYGKAKQPSSSGSVWQSADDLRGLGLRFLQPACLQPAAFQHLACRQSLCLRSAAVAASSQ